MLHTGLLWFDDDTKRPLAEKVADAVARYHERVGGTPTVCQLNPASATLLAEQQQKQRQLARERKKTAGRRGTRGVAQAHSLRLPQLIPDSSLPLNYFFVGQEEATEVAPHVPAGVSAPEEIGTTVTAMSPTTEPSRKQSPERRPSSRAGRQTIKTDDPMTAPERFTTTTNSDTASAPSIRPVSRRSHAERAPSREEPASDELASAATGTERLKHSRRTRTLTLPERERVDSGTGDRVEQARPALPDPRVPKRKLLRTPPLLTQPPLPLWTDQVPPASKPSRRRAS